MLGAGGGWGGGGGGLWDGMVGVVDEVGIVGDDVKLGGAAVVPLRCMGGKVIVDDKIIYCCWSSLHRGSGLLLLGVFVGQEFFLVGILLF